VEWKKSSRMDRVEKQGVSTCNPYASQEILEHLTKSELNLVHVDAPLSSPKNGTIRKGNRETYMHAKLIGDGEETYIVDPTKGD
jgi:predicted nuclease with RNAse H fold